MASTEDRFSMPAEKYLSLNNVYIYLEDCIAQLLEHRDENPKVQPIKFLREYFQSLKDGNHTMFREYSFISATQHNRASFIRLFWKCFRQIGKKGDLLSSQEYHSLFRLICPDFPFEPVQKTAKIILLDDAMDCLISFSDFLFAFQLQFYYEDFLSRCQDTYQSLIQKQRSPRDPVVVPNINGEGQTIHQNSQAAGDGVDAGVYFRALCPMFTRYTFCCPPIESLQEILCTAPRVSYYGFLMALAKSEIINDSIGRLPSKAELLEGADFELSTPTVRSKSSKSRPTSVTIKQSNRQPTETASNKTLPDAMSHLTTKQKNAVIKKKPLGRLTKHGNAGLSDSSSESGDQTNSSTDTN